MNTTAPSGRGAEGGDETTYWVTEMGTADDLDTLANAADQAGVKALTDPRHDTLTEDEFEQLKEHVANPPTYAGWDTTGDMAMLRATESQMAEVWDAAEWINSTPAYVRVTGDEQVVKGLLGLGSPLAILPGIGPLSSTQTTIGALVLVLAIAGSVLR